MKSGTYRFKINIDIKLANKLGDMDRKDLKEMLKDCLEKHFLWLSDKSEYSIRIQ